MKIVVTGALGHIGSALIRRLPDLLGPLEIVMIDNLSTQRYCGIFNLPSEVSYRFFPQNVQEVDWGSVLVEAACVVHLAAMTDAAGTADKPDIVYKNNFGGTSVVAEACLKYDVPIIFPSSTSVYGSQSSVVDETCKELQPQSPYAHSKITEENFVTDLVKKGLKACICRFGTIYGTSIGMRFHTAVNKFCWQAVTGQPITVWRTAFDQKRPYLALGDACAAIFHIIKSKLFDGSVYNVVSNNHTVREVLDSVQKFVPNTNIEFVDHQIMNQLSYEVLSSKFENSGFRFAGQLEQGVEETIGMLGGFLG